MQDLWHAEEADVVLKKIQSSREGLSGEEVRMRRVRFGDNVLPHQKARSDIERFADQFANPLLLLLAVAWAISIALRHYTDAAFIGFFIFVNTAVAFYQERKAARALEALRSLVKVSARLLRGGRRAVIDASGLVPGDIIELSAGDKVPADARLLVARDMRVDESSLTGEWLAVSKSVEAVAADAPLAERSSMVFMSTVVEAGEATAVVVATGSGTEIGSIAVSIGSVDTRRTPLQENMARLARIAAVAIVGLIGIILAIGLWRGQAFGETFVVALALAVSAIPANFLPAVTLILSLGMSRSLKRRALVQRLSAGETLGSVTVICTDKTGTLTTGTMEVSRILVGDELLGERVDAEDKATEDLRVHALERAALGCSAFIENPDDDMHEWLVRGRATEAALVAEAHRQGIEKHRLEKVHPLLDRAAFTSATKYSASLRRGENGGSYLSVLGAPEIVLGMCSSMRLRDGKHTLTVGARKKMTASVERLATSGLRLVAVATKEFKKRSKHDEGVGATPARLTLVGLIALKDPLRTDAREWVLTAERAGIRTVLITGDHAGTALSVAHEVGIESRNAALMTGSELDALSDEDLLERARSISMYARVSPEHKLRIVRALQKRGEVVAMVGDGVNDAPALRAADVGIAVGSGTDVAKEAADMVLLDDSFRSIIAAVEEGRLMFRNIRKVFAYLIGDDLSELSLFFGAFLVGLPLPLLPTQILWINIVEDAFPVAGLAAEEDRSGIMDEPPRGRTEPIAHAPLRRWLIAVFWITGIAAFLSFVFFLRSTSSIEQARSMIFALLSIDSLILSFSVRSFSISLWRKDIFANRALTLSAAIGVALILAGLYVPPLQAILQLQPLGVLDWLLILFISLVEIVLIEGYKKLYFQASETVG